MSFLKPKNASEAADLIANATGCALGGAAIIYVTKVAEGMVQADLAAVLDYVQITCAATLLLIYLPFMISVKSRFGGIRVNPWKSESFLAASMRKAAWTTVGVLLICLTLMSTMDNLILSRISSEQAVNVTLAVLFLSLCASFFIYSNDRVV